MIMNGSIIPLAFVLVLGFASQISGEPICQCAAIAMSSETYCCAERCCTKAEYETEKAVLEQLAGTAGTAAALGVGLIILIIVGSLVGLCCCVGIPGYFIYKCLTNK